MAYKNTPFPIQYTILSNKWGAVQYESGISYVEAGVIYGISDETARRYQLFYEESNGLSHHTKKSLPDKLSAESISQNAEPISSTTNYEDITKEELLQELMKAKIREARLKKGYIVKGAHPNITNTKKQDSHIGLILIYYFQN